MIESECERERVCVCVCEREGEREREREFDRKFFYLSESIMTFRNLFQSNLKSVLLRFPIRELAAPSPE